MSECVFYICFFRIFLTHIDAGDNIFFQKQQKKHGNSEHEILISRYFPVVKTYIILIIVWTVNQSLSEVKEKMRKREMSTVDYL